MKVFEFLRVTDQFGKFVNLFFNTIYGIRWYMGFFTLWIAQFTILYQILDVESKGWLLTYNQWESGVGAGGIPTLRAGKPAPSITALLYIIWVLNQFILVVVNLNFLIAVISQSYEESMNNMVINQYRTRAEMNQQVYKNMHLLGWFKDRFRTVIVAQEVDNDNAINKNEWNGYAQTVKTYLKKQFETKVEALQKILSAQSKAIADTDAKIDATAETTKAQIKALDAKLDAQAEATKALEAKMDAKMDAILELLSKN